ncbi:MAG TPA: hypothetical protein VL171_09575 [Verrucomicrobiae bacterium]|nr:hypothetical protein [Verrucomicrobiae bacterium]
MRAFFFMIVLMGALATFVSGCATTKEGDDVSSIPWNRPQNWEGQGALGGFRPPGSPGY